MSEKTNDNLAELKRLITEKQENLLRKHDLRIADYLEEVDVIRGFHSVSDYTSSNPASE